MTELSRRDVMRGALGVAAAGALAGCTGSGELLAGDRTLVRYWNLFGGGDGVTMNQMLDAFRAANPTVDLESVTLTWGPPYYTKLAMAGAGGRAPHVAVMHLARLPGYAPAGLLDPFDPRQLASVGLTEADFPRALWERGHHDGSLYAIPFDTHPFVTYFDAEVCRQAGLLDPGGLLRPMTSPDEVLTAFRAVKEATGRHAVVFETTGPDCVIPWRLFWTLYSQLGGQLLTPDLRASAIDDDKALQVLEFMRRITAEGLAPSAVDYAGSVAWFSSRKATFHWNGEWEIASFDTAGIPYGMALFPTLYGQPAVQADSHAFVLPHRMDRTPAENRATYEFIAFMLRNSVTWAQGGHIPAYQPVARGAEYRSMRPQSLYAAAVDAVRLDPPVWYGGSASLLWIQFGAAFSSVLTGHATPRQGLDEAKRALQRLIDTPNPTV